MSKAWNKSKQLLQRMKSITSTIKEEDRPQYCEDNGVSCMVGIILTDETNISQSGICLGFVQSPKKQLHNGSLCLLRETLSHQIPSIPHSYSFITKHGWPVSKAQEDSIKTSHLIRDDGSISIQSTFEKPRVGIKAKTGMSLGFLFVLYDTKLDELRHLVVEQLPFFRGLSTSYQFVDTNGWPISHDQEGRLTVLQILSQSCVTVCTDVTVKALIEYGACNGCSNTSHESGDSVEPRVKGQKELLYHSKDQQRASRDSLQYENTDHKQILISYVRAEAAHHALQLKNALANHGCSVFLDVHEIKTGVDWQDSLNYAVSNCEVFVPLVTPRYGETQWTNREVKLADVLDKFILPVSFLDEWPPRCLAIQFATTQFVPWEKPVPDNHSVFRDDNPFSQRDIYKWSEESTREVAMEIIERIRQHKESQRKGVVFVKQRSVLRSYPNFPGIADINGIEDLQQSREGLPMVVILVHQENTVLGNTLKRKLEEKNYVVWCTTEIETQEDDIISSQSDSAMLSPGVQSCLSSDTSDSILSGRMIFQEKANDAGVVIMVLSAAFSKSKVCKQQVFYCEHRKRVIPLVIEDFVLPGWLSLLIGNKKFESALKEGYEERVLDRVQQATDPSQDDTFIEEGTEAQLLQSVKSIWKRVNRDNAIYISGSTSFHNKSSEAICRAIGKHLANLNDITVVTGGFYGVGDTVGRAFYEEVQRLWKKDTVFHVLPRHDPKIQNDRADQNPDGSFNKVRYGRTLFTAGTVSDRECIVARAFAICILIEGGPGSAHEAEQFAWSDNIVIPIRCTGGAASGLFGVPLKIFECPRNVDDADWELLNHPELSPHDMGQLVARLVRKLQNNNDSLSQVDDEKINAKRPRRLKGVSMPADCNAPSLAKMKTMILG